MGRYKGWLGVISILLLGMLLFPGAAQGQDFEDPGTIDPGDGGDGAIIGDIEFYSTDVGGEAADAWETMEPQATILLIGEEDVLSSGGSLSVEVLPVFTVATDEVAQAAAVMARTMFAGLWDPRAGFSVLGAEPCLAERCAS